MSVLKNKQIIVVGSPGSGKSYMTKQIHLITGIPLYYMDCIYHKENWTHISKEELEEILTDIMKTDEWIIDGFYSRTLEMRLKVARTVVFLDIDENICIEQEKARRGKKRDDLPSFLVEEEDPEFENFIKNFRINKRPWLLDLFKQYPDKEYIVFHNREEEKEFLEALALEYKNNK